MPESTGWTHEEVVELFASNQEMGQAIVRLRADNAELQALFDMQHKRMGEATAMWVAEDPESRALMLPDLGQLLSWLMDRIVMLERSESE